PVELGAEFVHGRPEEILGLAAEAALPLVPVEGEFCRKIDAKWSNAGHLMHEIEDLFAKMTDGEPDQSFQHYVDCAGPPEEVGQHALGYIEGFHAADPSLISVLSLVRDIQAEEAIGSDGRQVRFASGYNSLVQAMKDRIAMHRLDLRLKAVVTEIQWCAGDVLVKTSNGEFRAPRAIITLPLGVLKANGITFRPELPEKQNAMKFLEMGAATHVTLCFRERF